MLPDDVRDNEFIITKFSFLIFYLFIYLLTYLFIIIIIIFNLVKTDFSLYSTLSILL